VTTRDTTIPGTFRLEHIRGVVRAIAGGARGPADAVAQMGLGARHVSFAVHSARLLGWLAADGWAVTGAGRELLDTTPGSAEEAQLFQLGIAGCAVVRKIAPDLLAPEGPAFDELSQRISRLTGLAAASAQRSARVLLSWRRQALRAPDAASEPEVDAAEPAVRDDEGGASPRLALLEVEGLGPFRAAEVPLRPLTVLLGGTGAGKSTLVDSLALVADALHHGLHRALQARGARLDDLLHHTGGRPSSRRARKPERAPERATLGLALELQLPEALRPERKLALARYELTIGPGADGGACVLGEALRLKPEGGHAAAARADASRQWRGVIERGEEREVVLRAERSSWELRCALPGSRLALAALPDDAGRFPAALAIRRALRRAPERVSIRTDLLRTPCSPLSEPLLRNDGANLALVVQRLRRTSPERVERWLDHVRMALPDVRGVTIVERPEDRHLALALDVGDQLVPIQRLSDGALRLLALALLPHGADPASLVLVEDPALDLAPRAAAAVARAWTEAASDAAAPQLLVSTHSPLWARLARPEQVLCVARGRNGEARVMPGRTHAAYKAWRRKLDVEAFFFD
jgi:predicted ATPase